MRHNYSGGYKLLQMDAKIVTKYVRAEYCERIYQNFKISKKKNGVRA